MRRRSAPGMVLAVAGALLVSGCVSSSHVRHPAAFASPAGRTALAWGPCDASSDVVGSSPAPVDFQCARFPVPLGASGRTVELAVTRRRATGPGARIGSLFVNPGGPGASAVGFLQQSWSRLPAELAQRFDLVAFDPRGVGGSAPIRCATTAGLDTYVAVDPSPDDPAELAALEAADRTLVAGCRQRAGDLLPYVSTVDAAADLERLRQAVGDDRLSYLGYSYGTAIGAAYLDAFGPHVRAMVLDGAVDPTLDWQAYLAGQAAGFDHALAAFLADCDRTACAFRGSGAAFDALAAGVDSRPLPAEGGRRLGPGELTLGVGAGLYDRAGGWPRLARALAAAQHGDGTALLAMSDSYLRRTPAGYANITEANVAVSCLDRPWPRDPAAYPALAAQVARTAPRFGAAIVMSGLVCADWPVPPAATPHPVRGQGSPPVVVIGTTGDPATPYSWAVALAGQLDSGVLLTHVGEGHTVFRQGAPDCIVRPVDGYLLAGVVPAAGRC